VAAVKIFLSYRRDSDGARAALVEKSIEGGFPATKSESTVHIFRDVRQRLGVDWPPNVEEELAASDIVVVVIGPDWLSTVDQYFKRRIDQADDWVRKEIALSLEQGKTIIPILFDDTAMPPVEALPESIAELSKKHGLPVRTSYFDTDVQPLLREIMEFRAGARDKGYRRSTEDYRDTRWPYPDPPLPVRPAQLSDEDIESALRDMIPTWSRVEGPLPEDENRKRVELARKFEFPAFLDVLEFMTEVGRFCDDLNHHPRWENIYRTLWVYLSTWDIGHRISHLDLILAAHMDKAFVRHDRTKR
jgi:pterin-4a-carbinolamine dehydratase